MTSGLDLAERRRRLVTRHRVGAIGTEDPAAVAGAVLALHATDPVSVHLQVAARSTTATPDDVEAALYEDRTVLRLMGMRRTLFVTPTDIAPLIQHGATDRVATDQRRRLIKELTDAGTVSGDVARWVDELADATVAAVADLGGSAGTEKVIKAVPRLRTSLVLSPGKGYEATVTVGSRMMVLLGCQGRLVRGRAGGSWGSRRYPWVLPEQWLGHPFPDLDAETARRELVRRWLRTFGPAPESDLKWWTGWPLSRLRPALAQLPVTTTEQGWLVLSDDREPTPEPAPGAALLPVLDPTVMGWSERGWFLGPYAPRLFDRNGNAGATIWWNGAIVGGWAQAADGELRLAIFDDVGRTARTAIEAEADRLARWIGERRFVPTFRTPTELELLA